MSGAAERLTRFIREHLEFPPESHIQIRMEDGKLVAECDACGARHEMALEDLDGPGDTPADDQASGAGGDADPGHGESDSGDPPPAGGQQVESSSAGDPGA